MFCDIGPTCYKIALQKEICKRHIKNFFVQESYADTQDTAPLPCIVAQYSSHLIKRGKGIDPVLQENKAVNIRLANEKLNGILIRRSNERRSPPPERDVFLLASGGQDDQAQGLPGWADFGA